jgi:hypothetical protein
MATQQANKERTMAIGHGYDLQNKGVDQKNREKLAVLNAKLSVEQKQALSQIELAAKQQGRANDINFKYQAAKNAGFSDEQAALYSLGLLNGSGSSGKSKGKSADGGLKTSEAVSIVKLYQDWNEKNPDNESANPFKDAYEEATAVLNNQQSAPSDVNDSRSVYSWAQSILEENYRRGYPATPDALYQVISSVGGYGKAVADDLKEKGMLDKYGRTN